jgi:DNA-binding HxlR family transcriptional regulator
MTKSEAKKLHCTVEAAIAVIGGKYKAIIIWWLNEKGVMRYSEIQRRVPQATAKMLSQQLREMEADGIISRKVYPVVPPKTEYALTDLGKATVPIVHAMDKWGADFFTRLGVPIPCDEEE